MPPNDRDRIESDLRRTHPEHGGWNFSRDVGSGAFHYWRGAPNSPVVYFSPDWTKRGWVDIQVVDENGDLIVGAEIPFPVRTAEELFRIVKPWLDQYASGEPEEWGPGRSARSRG